MKINSVYFEAFKSLDVFEAQFENLTVITGPNGSGKSNLVDGLNFIGNTYLHGLELAVSYAGGYENIAFRRGRRSSRSIKVATEVELTDKEVNRFLRRGSRAGRKLEEIGADFNWPDIVIRHEFSFKALSEKVTADFEVINETITVHLGDGRKLVTIVRNKLGEVRTEVNGKSEGLKLLGEAILEPHLLVDNSKQYEIETSDLFLDNFHFFGVFAHVKRFLSRVRVFQLSPNISRLPGVPSPRAQMERFGENLAGAADFIKKNKPDAWERIQSSIKVIMPTLDEIVIAHTEDRRLAVRFREVGVGRPWSSTEVSDGTIQTFALLVAIFDPRASILVIEEMENALHPWILRLLLQLCQESDRQILLTSHSPVLLSSVPGRTVYLMWMEEGKSKIECFADIDPDLTQAIVDGDMTVFELLDSGLITDSIPRGYV